MKILYYTTMVMMMISVGVNGMSWWNMPFRPYSSDFHFLDYNEPFPGALKRANFCRRRIDPDCGRMVYDYIFMFSPLSDYCCKNFVDNGRDCNNSINLALSTTKRFRKYAGRMRDLTSRLFDECRVRVY